MISNRAIYLQKLSNVQELKLVLVGQDPYPNGSNGIAFSKNTFTEFFHPSCCGKEVLYSLGYDQEYIESHFNNPNELFFYLLEQGIGFINVSSLLLDKSSDNSLLDDKKYNINFLNKTQNILLLGLGKTTSLFEKIYYEYPKYKALIHPSGLAKKNHLNAWMDVWSKPHLKTTYLSIFNSKINDMQLDKYFDLTVKNEKLYSAGNVEDGYIHGVEFVDGEYYATLYHIQKSIAKGKLKEFIDQFQGSKMLAELGERIAKEYSFKTLNVKYDSQSYEIKKYPYSAVLGYFQKLNPTFSPLSEDEIESVKYEKIKQSVLEKTQVSSGIKEVNRPVRLGKAAGELSVGMSTLVEYLASKGIEVDISPNYKLSAKEYRILKLEFSTNLKNTIQLVSEELKVGMTPLVELLEENGFGISKPFQPSDPLTDDEYYFLVEQLSKTEPKITLDQWLEELGELKSNGIGVGFKNFRRFESFPMIELGEINFLVGKNNSGKSTLVKAILLFLNCLKQPNGQRFTFAGNVLNDANIVTFDRAIYRNNTNGQIDFELKLGSIVYSVNISGKEDSTDATINVLKFYELNTQTYFEVDFNTNEINFVLKKEKDSSISGDHEEIQWYKNQISSLKKELSSYSNKLSKEGLSIIDKINKLQSQLENLKFLIPETTTKKEDITYAASLREPLSDNYSLKDAVTDFYMMIDLDVQGMFDPSDKEMEKMSDKELELIQLKRQKVRALKNDINIHEIFNQVLLKIGNERLFYLGANPSKQSALFLIRDKGNALAQAIHEFKQADIKKGTEIDLFVIKWMKEFEIGQDYKIKIKAGEAYEFYILDQSGEHHLSDKGMGSLQIMMLILTIAALIHNESEHENKYTILVEEPELNLHPKLQSKLTELFHYVNKKHGFRFIIETHSEYMIRQSQVKVNIENYGKDTSMNPNPFKVFYFPDDKPVYEMEYREDGKFSNSFGPGFFDVSSNLVFELL